MSRSRRSKRVVDGVLLLGIAAVATTCGPDATGPGHAGPAAAMQIVAGDQQSAQAGTELPAALAVKVLDAQGRIVSGQVVNFRVTAGGGSVFAGVALTNDSGVARERWTVGTSTADSQRVEARAIDSETGKALTFAVFGATALPGPPAKLRFSVPPSNTVAGVAISPGVQVVVQDQYGNTVTGSTASIAVAITGGTGTTGAVLGGTLTQAAVAGTATFSDLAVDKAGTGYTLTATATGLASATGATFNVAAGAPAKLAFQVQPSPTTAGAAISPAVEVTVQDAQGNAATALALSVTVSITPSTGTTGAHLRGTTTVTAPGGVVTFAALSIDSVGTSYTLTASAPGLASATSAGFDVSAAPATRLVFFAQPSNVTAGTGISPAAQVVVQDSVGNTATSSVASITVAITSGTGTAGAILGGTLTRAAVAGVATFADLTVDKAGSGYTLTAVAANLTSGTSAAFSVTPGAATKLGFARPLSGVVAGVAIAPAVQVVVQDAYGNTVTGSAASIAVAITSGTGTTGTVLGGTLTRVAVSGVATFADLTLDRIGTGYSLTATSAGLASAISNAVEATSPMTVSGVTPADGRMAGGAVVTITGVAFVNVTAVSIGGAALGSVNVLSSTQITGVTPAGASSGGKDVVVASSTYGSATCPGCFIYHPWSASISVGHFGSTCGLTVSGAAYCWGNNEYGQLGDGTFGVRAFRSNPVAVVGGLTFQAIGVGEDRTCGLTPVGAVYCWGYNYYGELGDGTTTPHLAPMPVAGGLSFQALSAGQWHTCGLTPAGAAYCWGYNGSGQLGIGTTTSSSVPVAVVGGLTFQTISAGSSHTCGLISGGAAYCWGLNGSGQLGDGTRTVRTSPVAAAAGLTFQAISAGDRHTCGLTAGGAAYCWGYNADGELGDGTGTDNLSPVAVAGGLTFQTISAGYDHTCGLTTAGVAYCWGGNWWGQLGIGSTDPWGSSASHFSPEAVVGGLTWQALTARTRRTCGVTTAGAAYCWGTAGVEGYHSASDSNTPVRVVDP